MHIYTAWYIYTCLNETKKGGETSKYLKLKRGNIGIANMHKSIGDKIGILDGWVIQWLGDAATSALPLGRHASTSPIIVAEVP